jgi:hypothetical protein
MPTMPGVRFVIPDRNLLRVLMLTGPDQLLSIYPSLGAAVSAGPVLDADAAPRWSRSGSSQGPGKAGHSGLPPSQGG